MNEIDMIMGEKRRREFRVYRRQERDGEFFGEHEVANGVLYDEGNVQVLWREDVGNTSEQYANIGQVFGLVAGANCIEVWDPDSWNYYTIILLK